ncbi:acyclic terpene utilization AtuA family protein [Inquilinus sp.]|jgi:hypothetical protein|uniref:acyclic terpene utilization AtuA family protein n=1 Tax=Inquilinus sp. TaxID=1932117 RepID=UPI0037836EA6
MPDRMMRIGAGAGFAGDRLEPAAELVARGRLDALVFECLAERTIALAHRRRRADPDAGCDPLLERRLRPVLPGVAAQGIRVLTNMGAADPVGAGRRAAELCRELGIPMRIAVVTGDDVLDRIDPAALALEDGRPLAAHGPLIAANAYLGADAMLPALEAGAQLVITGRVADPSLFVAPLAWRFGWALDDAGRIATATLAGHLMECAGQVTGGYFADADGSDVPGLADLGFPIAEVTAAGGITVTKLPGTGGRVSRATVTEQLLYEVTDPGAYVTPDVVLDVTGVAVAEQGADRVAVTGARGQTRPPTLKVSVAYEAGWEAEAGVSYGGSGAVERGRRAAEIVRERLERRGDVTDLRLDLVGVDSLLPGRLRSGEPSEVRLRLCARAATAEAAGDAAREVESLYTNGPAAGGGVRSALRPVVGIVSTLIDRRDVSPAIEILEA